MRFRISLRGCVRPSVHPPLVRRPSRRAVTPSARRILCRVTGLVFKCVRPCIASKKYLKNDCVNFFSSCFMFHFSCNLKERKISYEHFFFFFSFQKRRSFQLINEFRFSSMEGWATSDRYSNNDDSSSKHREFEPRPSPRLSQPFFSFSLFSTNPFDFRTNWEND